MSDIHTRWQFNARVSKHFYSRSRYNFKCCLRAKSVRTSTIFKYYKTFYFFFSFCVLWCFKTFEIPTFDCNRDVTHTSRLIAVFWGLVWRPYFGDPWFNVIQVETGARDVDEPVIVACKRLPFDNVFIFPSPSPFKNRLRRVIKTSFALFFCFTYFVVFCLLSSRSYYFISLLLLSPIAAATAVFFVVRLSFLFSNLSYHAIPRVITLVQFTLIITM